MKEDRHPQQNERDDMEKRSIGNSGLETFPLALGGNVFGWTADEPTSFKLLDAFIDAGFSLIDTADVYSAWVPELKGGESETIIGRWQSQRKCREKILIATKVGLEMGPGKKGLSRKYIMQAVEDSLKRLQTDYIDLYQSHKDDPETPLEETLEAFAELKKQGKVRAIGASNYSAPRLQKALDISKKSNLPRYESLQTLYNLTDRKEFESGLNDVCSKNNLGVLTYYSLASGFLTGKYRSEADLSKSPRGASVKDYLNERGMRILSALDKVALDYKATPAKISLSWLMTHPAVTAPIVSATNLEQLDDIIASTKIKLDATAVKYLNDASAP